MAGGAARADPAPALNAHIISLTWSCARCRPIYGRPLQFALPEAVFTSDGSRTLVEALAIRGDRIVAVGTSAEID